MPRIIDYTVALEQLQTLGVVSVYPNGGALGFARGTGTHSVGWIGRDDPSIRPEAIALARPIPAPVESNLASLVVRAWELIEGPIWVMPSSHWAFELDFGSREWLPGALAEIGIDAGSLQAMNNASPIEFSIGESDALGRIVMRLLEQLQGSDFTLAFPSRTVCALVHHHKQIWWTSTDTRLIKLIDQLVNAAIAPGPS